LLPEISRVVLVILIANFVAALLPVILPLPAIFNSTGPILGKVIAGRAGPASIWSAGTT
jgi:hypothetical protein